MRVGFAGTPAFAASALTAILAAGHEVPLVLTRPDRPSGRGLRLDPLPVKVLAQEYGVALLQPASLAGESTLAALRAIPLDVLVVAAYGLLLPPVVLAWPRHGCLNIHASLLPRWRGAAPIARALLAGDTESGVTIMQMDAGLDTGPVHGMERVPIAPRETGGTLHDKLAAAGSRSIVGVLDRLAREGTLRGTAQSAEGVTYASKIARTETALDWRAPAGELDRRVRAFHPSPGTFTTAAGERIKVGAGEPVPPAMAPASPGTVIGVDARGLTIACGDGALLITELQPAGGRRMPAAAYAAGRRIVIGHRFDVTPA